MATTIRHCLMCQTPMQCSRANKLICSNYCHSRMFKQRTKLGLSNSEMIQELKQKQKELPDAQTTN